MSKFALLLGLGLLATPVAAQDMPTVLPQNYVLSDILNRHRIDAAIGTPASPRRRASKPAARPSAPVPTTRYRPSTDVSLRVRKQFVGRMGSTVGAADAGKLGAALERGDPVQSWSKIVASDGLHTDDIADSLTGYWVLNWAMANGADNNRSQSLAVRRQVEAILAANPRLAGQSDAQRQEMSETFILNFLIQHAVYVDAMRRGDRDTMRRLGDAAVARFRSEMGVDLRQLRLTDAGFVPL